MSVAVVGFDVGCLTSYVAVARAGGIETITNEYSERQTPTCVAFSEKNRLIGTSAKLQHATNVKNTFANFLPLVGKKFNDPAVMREQKYLPFKIECGPEGRVLIKVNRSDGPLFFTPEQLVAMQLTKLREIAEKELSTRVMDVVINVPTYYTDAERRAMLDATKIAGLNCVKLVNDTTAIGTAYGLYKDLPPADKPPRNVAFVNVGFVSTQVAVCTFNTGKMKVLCTASDWQLGGRDFDAVIFQKLADDFETKYGKKVGDYPKAVVRLLQECEKVKKAMSANSQELPLNVECLLDEKDLMGHMKRADFEAWTTDLQARFAKLLQQCLADSKLNTKDIHAVEMVGGSSRIPILRSIVASVFNQEVSTTLNADEVVARGCALQAAICSPVFKVREFSVTEACPYAITLHWDLHNSTAPSMPITAENDGEVALGQNDTCSEVFPLFYPIPASRRLSFNRQGPFTLEARYSNPDALPNQNVIIGVFKVSNPYDKSNEPSKIRVKVRINSHGILSIAQAEVAEEYEKEVEVEAPKEAQSNQKSESTDGSKPMDVEATPNNGDVCMEASADAGEAEKANTTTAGKPAPPQKTIIKKKAIRYKDLPVDAIVAQLGAKELNEFCEIEGKLFEQDQLEHHRSHAKNAVEEYIYEMKGKLQDSLSAFATANDQEALMDALNSTEDWLYGDGEELHRQAYVDRLAQLKLMGDPIEMRAFEKQGRTHAVNDFEHSLVRIRKVLDSALAGEEAYNHLTPEQLDQLNRTLTQYDGWLRDRMRAQDARPLTEDPVVKTSEITAQQKAMEAICYPIIDTPKPAPPPPVPDGTAETPQPDANNHSVKVESPNAKNGSKGKSSKSPKPQQQNCNSNEMDVD